MKRKVAGAASSAVGEITVRKCVDCRREVIGVRKTYHYTECGLSNVRLANILVFECVCGTVMPEIPAIDALHDVLAVGILQKKTLLTGDEVRFLRKMTALTQAQLAEIMGVHKTRPSKWESGEEPIGKENDRVLRSCALFGMLQQAISSDVPAEAMRSAASVIRSLDVTKIFRELKNDRSSKPSDHVFENDPTAVGSASAWLPAKTVSGQLMAN